MRQLALAQGKIRKPMRARKFSGCSSIAFWKLFCARASRPIRENSRRPAPTAPARFRPASPRVAKPRAPGQKLGVAQTAGLRSQQPRKLKNQTAVFGDYNQCSPKCFARLIQTPGDSQFVANLPNSIARSPSIIAASFVAACRQSPSVSFVFLAAKFEIKCRCLRAHRPKQAAASATSRVERLRFAKVVAQFNCAQIKLVLVDQRKQLPNHLAIAADRRRQK